MVVKSGIKRHGRANFGFTSKLFAPPTTGSMKSWSQGSSCISGLGGQFQLLPANSRGHFEVTPLGVELGLWDERYQNVELPWLRWWDDEGNLLLTGEERAEQEHQRAEQERQRAEQERQRAERLAALLREQGIEFDDPWV